VQLAEGRALFGTGAEAAGTFHPFGDSGDPQEPGLVSRPRRAPGQMPWRTFMQGSYALAVVWGVGFVWSIFNILFHVDIPIQPVVPGVSMVGTPKHPELIFSDAMPHPFFTPRGMSCHADMGPTLLIYERYAVHSLRLAVDPTTGMWGVPAGADLSPEPALMACLDAAGDFRAEGMDSLSLTCSHQSPGCTATVLGAHGQHTLQCPLGGHDVGVEAAPASEAAEVYGGPWRAFTSADSPGAAAWAVRRGRPGAFVQLQRRSGTSPELVPQVEIAGSAASSVSSLHALDNSTVVGLEAGGRVHAWFLQSGSQLSWQLPPTTRWSGLCVANSSLYLLGTQTRQQLGRIVIFRSALPPELLGQN